MSTGLATQKSQDAAIARKDPMNNLRGLLQQMAPQLAMALPSHLKPERMIRVATTALQVNPKLQECSARSIIACVVEASQLGLEPCGALGHAYLIPYSLKGVMTCQLIPGYKGLLHLVRNSGQLKTVTAEVVYESDEFNYELGDQPRIRHVPSTVAEPGKVLYVYAVAELMSGGVQRVVLPVREVEKIRKRSRSANNGPWVTDWEEMAKKTALRRLTKLLPMSIEVQRAVELDERDDSSRYTVQLADELQIPRIEGDNPEPTLLLTAEEEPGSKPVDTLDAVADDLESKGFQNKPKRSIDGLESPPDYVELKEVK